MRSLQQYLVTVAVLLVLLICAAATLLIYQVDRFGRAQSEQQLLATTRALSLVVDGELKRYEAILQGLSTSDALARENWPAFDRRARALLSGRDAWIVVGDRAGRQLVNTRLAPGAALPAGRPPASLLAELDKGKSRVCNLGKGYLAPHILCVDLPIMRGGRAAYHLSVVMLPSRIGAAMGGQRIQEGAFATVLDRRGIVVWRNRAPERFIGRPGAADILLALKRSGEGVRDSRSLEGVPTVASYSRSSLSGWTFVVALPRAAMRAGTYRALTAAAGGAALLLVLGALIGLRTARRVNRAVKSLSTTAAQLERGEGPGFDPSGIVEIDAVGQALEGSLRAVRESEERYRRFFEQTSDLILTAGLDQVITDCNPSAAAAVGLPREEAIGRKISEFVSPEDFDRTTEMLRRKMTEGGTTRYDVRVRSSTGDWLYWEINSGLTYDRDQRPVGLHVVGRDITERKRAEEHQRLLINELNHRVKNTLAVVQSIAHQTLRRGGVEPAARDALEGRLAALSAAHDVLTRESWSAASLSEIVANAVAPFCTPDRYTLEGPDIRLNPRTAVNMALAVHELATNAAKYGALSNAGGRILISWSTETGRLAFTWREEGGPAVSTPSNRGFGSRMIEQGLAAELGGTAELTFAEEGVVLRLNAPIPEAE